MSAESHHKVSKPKRNILEVQFECLQFDALAYQNRNLCDETTQSIGINTTLLPYSLTPSLAFNRLFTFIARTKTATIQQNNTKNPSAQKLFPRGTEIFTFQ